MSYRQNTMTLSRFTVGSLFPCLIKKPPDFSCDSHAVKIPEPLIRIELEETSCWTFDWANSELVAIGTTNGRFILSLASQKIGLSNFQVLLPYMTSALPLNPLTTPVSTFQIVPGICSLSDRSTGSHHKPAPNALHHRTSIRHPRPFLDPSPALMALRHSANQRGSDRHR